MLITDLFFLSILNGFGVDFGAILGPLGYQNGGKNALKNQWKSDRFLGGYLS